MVRRQPQIVRAAEPLDRRQEVANPAARSLAAFRATRRPDSDNLVRGLLDERSDYVAAGDLVADGVTVLPHTRDRTIEGLVHQIQDGSDNAPDCLRVPRKLSSEADVLAQLNTLAEGDTTADVHLSTVDTELVR